MEHQGKCFWRPGEAFPYPDPCTYEWTLARDIFTSPVVTNSTTRVITFPYAGEQWVDWFNEALVYNGYVPNAQAQTTKRTGDGRAGLRISSTRFANVCPPSHSLPCPNPTPLSLFPPFARPPGRRRSRARRRSPSRPSSAASGR